jgi:hypothetical protein
MTIKSQTLISDTNIKLTELISTLYNVMLLAFYRAIDQSKTIFNLVNGFMDEYEDESGVDTVNSTNELYNSTDDYYSPSIEGVDAYTKLLLHLDNNVTDSENTPKTVTNNGVTFSSSVKKFGTHSGVFDGSSYLTVPDSDDFAFGNGDFTIDSWVNYSDLSGHRTLCGQWPSGSSTLWYCNHRGAEGKLEIYFQKNGAEVAYYVTQASVNFTTNTWHHIAFVRSGNNCYIFADGVSKTLDCSTAFSSTDVGNPAGLLLIGTNREASLVNFMQGKIDELRISKGIARWTSNFTPPAGAYGDLASNMTLISNAQIATAVPTSARIVLFEEDVDAITLNTNLKAYISRDNGTTFSQVTLTNEGYYATSKNILCGLVDISGQPSGTNMKYKIETLNEKNLKIHGTGINWA